MTWAKVRVGLGVAWVGFFMVLSLATGDREDRRPSTPEESLGALCEAAEAEGGGPLDPGSVRADGLTTQQRLDVVTEARQRIASIERFLRQAAEVDTAILDQSEHHYFRRQQAQELIAAACLGR